MLKNPALGYTPVGLVDDDPRKKNLRLHGIRVLGTTDELPHLLRDNKPDEVIIAIPSAAGRSGSGSSRCAARWAFRSRPCPRCTSSSPGSSISPGSCVRSRWRTCSARGGRARHRLDRLVRDGRDRPRDGCGRLDRVGALSADRRARRGRADPRRPLGKHAGRHRARARRRAGVHHLGPVLGDTKNRAKMAAFQRHRPAVVFHAAA